MTAKTLMDFDVCECGDYRHQHDRNGRCLMCAPGQRPWDNCPGYRAAQVAVMVPARDWDETRRG